MSEFIPLNKAECAAPAAALYDRVYASTRRADILAVFQALRAASQDNYLPAIWRCTERCGMGRGTRT